MAVKLIAARRLGDERGWFTETYSEAAFTKLGIRDRFVQDNHSMSVPAGVLRGLHFQSPPHAQSKLVRCVRGSIWDVAVDVRKGSPTYGNWVAGELNAETGKQMFVPVGFAHGFITLEEHTEVEYKVSSYYAPGSEGGVIWNDPELRLPWPIAVVGPILSAKDQNLPPLSELRSPFDYDGVPLSLTEVGPD